MRIAQHINRRMKMGLFAETEYLSSRQDPCTQLRERVVAIAIAIANSCDLVYETPSLGIGCTEIESSQFSCFVDHHEFQAHSSSNPNPRSTIRRVEYVYLYV